MKVAVSFDEVQFFYPDGETPAIARSSFELKEGSFALVAGATGSGKSTLLRAVNGLVPHFTGGRFSGTVEVAGRSTLDNAPRDLADVVAFVPQDAGSSFVLDRVEDELAYAMENLAIPPERMRRRVEETLDLLDIEGLRGRSVRTLSGGERQRVAIAAALTPGARVLVLDEPTSQLDPQGAEDVLAALQRLVDDIGLTVVMAEHRLERVAGFVDVALGCRSGQPVVVGDVGMVLDLLEGGPPVTRLGRFLGWEPRPLTIRAARRHAEDLDLGHPSPPESEALPGRVLVEMESASAGYDDRPVIADVDLQIKAGEVIALMGRNGAGKTTLLRVLAGLHAPESGKVALAEGAPVRPGKDIALCPQAPETILFKERVIDEVTATLDAAGSFDDPESLLKSLGIKSLARRHPREISAGQRLLVAIAAIAATGAPVLLLDEPTKGLDPRSKELLADYVRQRARSGLATMFATHDVELVSDVATRVVMIAGGEVIADGSPADVLGDSPIFAPQMSKVFGAGWLTPRQVTTRIAEMDRVP